MVSANNYFVTVLPECVKGISRVPSHRLMTFQGTRTADNRDHAGFASQGDFHLYLIADGSSTSAKSGELAYALVRYMETGFAALNENLLKAAGAEALLLELLSGARHALVSQYKVACVSYLIVVLGPEVITVIHGGDCCFGRRAREGSIEWLTAPHCQPNWRGDLAHEVIARDVGRHRLTRSFSGRRELDPCISRFDFQPGSRWLLASDGFWADLSTDRQLASLEAGAIEDPSGDDDITCIEIRP